MSCVSIRISVPSCKWYSKVKYLIIIIISKHKFEKPSICLIWTLKTIYWYKTTWRVFVHFHNPLSKFSKQRRPLMSQENKRFKKQLQHQQNKKLLIWERKFQQKYLLVLLSKRMFGFCCWRLYISWSILQIKRILLDLKFQTSFEHRLYQKFQIWDY